MAEFLQRTVGVHGGPSRPPPPAGDDRLASWGAGHPRRGRVASGLVVGLVLAGFGCTTMHPLGRADDPATLAAVERATEGRETRARIEPLAGAPAPNLGDPVRAVSRDGLLVVPDSSPPTLAPASRKMLVAPAASPPTLVPLARVRSVSTYDHARGARQGAVTGGVPLAIIGGVLGTLLYQTWTPTCSDGCGDQRPNGAELTLGFAALFGAFGAVVGAGLGAIAGHEDRYVLAPE
jgi:hypothetical protein